MNLGTHKSATPEPPFSSPELTSSPPPLCFRGGAAVFAHVMEEFCEFKTIYISRNEKNKRRMGS